MTWRKREDTRRGDWAHGITFVMFEQQTPETRAEVACGPRKLHIDGPVSLTLAFDQTKYGDELIAQLFTRDGHRVADRLADGWNRVQIFLGPASEETALMLETLAAAIRSRAALPLPERT